MAPSPWDFVDQEKSRDTGTNRSRLSLVKLDRRHLFKAVGRWLFSSYWLQAAANPDAADFNLPAAVRQGENVPPKVGPPAIALWIQPFELANGRPGLRRILVTRTRKKYRVVRKLLQ